MKNFIITQEKINEIFDTSNPEHEFQKLPMQTAFYAIKSRGFDDATDLITLASTEQIIGFLDLDCWDKDIIDLPNLYQWLSLLTHTSEDKLAEVLKTIDLEILSYLFTMHTRIYRNNDSLDIRILRNFFYTADNQYVIEVTKKDYFEVIKKIAYKIGEDDVAFVVNFFESIAYTLPSTLEETAYEQRKARLEDLGIIDFYDAQDIYSYVKPTVGASLSDDTSFIEKISEESIIFLPTIFWESGRKEMFLDQAISQINDVVFLNSLKTQLLYLANKLISAHRINFSSMENIQERMEELRATLNLGLEYASQGNITTAQELLKKKSVMYLFKLGFSLTLDLKRHIQSFLPLFVIYSQAQLIDFFGEHYGSMIKGLMYKRPVLLSSNGEIHFIDSTAAYKKTFDTIHYLQNILEFLTQHGNFSFTWLNKLDQKQLGLVEKKEITFVHILNTLVAQHMLANRKNSEALDEHELFKFIRMAQSSNIREIVKNEICSLTNHNFSPAFYHDILKDSFDIFTAEIRDIKLTDFEARYITTVLVKPTVED